MLWIICSFTGPLRKSLLSIRGCTTDVNKGLYTKDLKKFKEFREITGHLDIFQEIQHGNHQFSSFVFTLLYLRYLYSILYKIHRVRSCSDQSMVHIYENRCLPMKKGIFLGPMWAKPAWIPPIFFSILMCFDQVYIISEEEKIHRVSPGMMEP